MRYMYNPVRIKIDIYFKILINLNYIYIVITEYNEYIF